MVYLSLGSNIGDRQLFLQLAIGLITYRIGEVKQVSSIVETPAWGFEGDAFYNACLSLETALSPQEVLKELIAIEIILGRKRKTTKEYQARNIDLDILLYGDELMNTQNLSIPHPRMEKRNFVLVPLAEIAANSIHPILKKSIKQLCQESEDPALVTPVEANLLIPQRKEFIAIEGNIGAGKTTFTHQLQAAIGGTLLLENFYDNPYLADFYQDPEAYALKVEKAFLEERIFQLSSFFNGENNFPVLADFSLEKSLLFAQQNLSETDFATYKKEYLNASANLPQPELVLFLAQSIPQLQKNIQKRGRGFEQSISDLYLQKIETGYAQWKENSPLNICELNTKGIDFVHDKNAFFSLLDAFFCA
jgi:2-amino-4-hydroxy-6-hydroxymethyldihydropteridine diphosphokinase